MNYHPLQEAVPTRMTPAPGRWRTDPRVAATLRRQVVQHTSGVLAGLLLVISGGALGVNGYQLWWTNQVASTEHASTVEDLRTKFDAARAQDAFESARVVERATVAADTGLVLGVPSYYGLDEVAAAEDARLRMEETLFTPGTPLGVVHIPRFGESFASPMISGTDDKTLEGGIGWNPRGARPGETGNLGLAGHRSTWGKPLAQVHDLEVGDPIIVETGAGWYVYTVVGDEIVQPTSTEVWAETPRRPDEVAKEAWATLVACHPPGSLAERWITYAQLSGFTPRSDGPPAELR